MQAAHILYPTKSRGLPTIVPIGMDQDVFVKLTRDIAPKIGLEKPGDIISKFIPGLTGAKMSSSKDETAIKIIGRKRYLVGDYASAAELFLHAFNGSFAKKSR